LNKINIITPPDFLFNDSFQLLLVYPSKQIQDEIQKRFLGNTTQDVNLYYYDKPVYDRTDLDWLIKVFNLCNTAIIDVDNTAPWVRDLLSYMIAKPKTYWLTNSQDSVYNILSNNRVYDLNFLSNTGEENVETE
jgi:hypothetical protein